MKRIHGVRGSKMRAKAARQKRRLQRASRDAALKQEWKRVASAKIAKMTTDEARAMIERFNAEGVTIYHATIRELTGGYNSQSINFYVIRKLGEVAGIIKRN